MKNHEKFCILRFRISFSGLRFNTTKKTES